MNNDTLIYVGEKYWRLDFLVVRYTGTMPKIPCHNVLIKFGHNVVRYDELREIIAHYSAN